MNIGGHEYPMANPVELIHKKRKDTEISNYIIQNLAEHLKPLIERYPFLEEYLSLSGKFIYYFICYILCKKSLGEEYTFLTSYTAKHKVFIPRRLLTLYFVLKTFGEYYIRK